MAKSREAVTRPGSPQSPVLPCDPSLPTCLLHLLESHGGATCAASLPAVPAWLGTHPWVHPCSHTGQCRRSLCRCPVGLPSPARMVRVPVSCRPPEMSFRTLRTSGQIFGFPHRTSFWSPLSDLWFLFCRLLSGPRSSLVSALLPVFLLLPWAGDGLAPHRRSCSRLQPPRRGEVVVFSW